jgi:FtsZ-binding cell division protein ZapB
VGSKILGARTERKWQSGRIEIPQVGDSGDGLLAYVDGLHTREGVREDLKAVFERNPNAIAIVDDCRHAWGAFVQAGVVDFTEQHESGNEYTFRLFADLGPGVATSNLGLIYHSTRAQEVNAAIRGVSSKFSQRLDPVQLLIRENELIVEVNRRVNDVSYVQQQNSQLQQQNSQLQQQNSQLQQQNSQLYRDNKFLVKTLQRRSHQAAEALATSAQKIPGIRNLIRKEK